MMSSRLHDLLDGGGIRSPVAALSALTSHRQSPTGRELASHRTVGDETGGETADLAVLYLPAGGTSERGQRSPVAVGRFRQIPDPKGSFAKARRRRLEYVRHGLRQESGGLRDECRTAARRVRLDSCERRIRASLASSLR